MQIKIITVGKLKEKYWRDAVAEYSKRLVSYAKIEMVEVAEEKTAENPGAAEIRLCLAKEGERINRNIAPSTYVIVLAINGKALSSEQLADLLDKLSVEGKSQLAFVIGGSYGLAPEVLARADYALSFSAMTFPHQMMRVILLEQVYRAFKISKGEPYHK